MTVAQCGRNLNEIVSSLLPKKKIYGLFNVGLSSFGLFTQRLVYYRVDNFVTLVGAEIPRGMALLSWHCVTAYG